MRIFRYRGNRYIGRNVECVKVKRDLFPAISDDAFANAITSGTITSGRAPPHSFVEIIRVNRSHGKIIVNMRTDEEVDPAYPLALREYENSGLWKKTYEPKEYLAIPTGEPEILTTAYVYEVF